MMKYNSKKVYFGSGITSILITLIILVLTCFAALSFVSADTEMKMSIKSKEYCDNYYAAETIATEILAGFSEDNLKIKQDKSQKIHYNVNGGYIVISFHNDKLNFNVPVNKKQLLHVTAEITDSDINITSWTVIQEDTDAKP